jgi:hypothetical protein
VKKNRKKKEGGLGLNRGFLGLALISKAALLPTLLLGVGRGKAFLSDSGSL